MWKLIAPVVGLALLAACVQPPTSISSSAIATGECPAAVGVPVPTSISELVQSPARYELKLVRVRAFYINGFEHSAIYGAMPSEGEPTPGLGIWASPLPDRLNGQRAELVGYFTGSVKGHGGQWPGSLCIVSATPARQDAP